MVGTHAYFGQPGVFPQFGPQSLMPQSQFGVTPGQYGQQYGQQQYGQSLGQLIAACLAQQHLAAQLGAAIGQPGRISPFDGGLQTLRQMAFAPHAAFAGLPSQYAPPMGQPMGGWAGYPQPGGFPAQGSFGPPQGSLGVPQGLFGSPQGSFGSPQGLFGSPEGSFGSPQGLFGAPQGLFGAPQGSFGSPQGSFGSPQGLFGVPQGSFGVPQGLFGVPQGLFGAPQGLFGSPQGQFGSLAGLAGALSGQFSPPFGTGGGWPGRPHTFGIGVQGGLGGQSLGELSAWPPQIASQLLGGMGRSFQPYQATSPMACMA